MENLLYRIFIHDLNLSFFFFFVFLTIANKIDFSLVVKNNKLKFSICNKIIFKFAVSINSIILLVCISIRFLCDM